MTTEEEYARELAKTLIIRDLEHTIERARGIASALPEVDRQVQLLGQHLRGQVQPGIEIPRLMGSINADMLEQEYNKIIADSTGQEVLVRPMSESAYRNFRRNVKAPGHGYFGREFRTEKDGTLRNVYLLPVDPQANTVVD